MALHVCRESRAHTLRQFTAARHSKLDTCAFYFNPRSDIFWLGTDIMELPISRLDALRLQVSQALQSGVLTLCVVGCSKAVHFSGAQLCVLRCWPRNKARKFLKIGAPQAPHFAHHPAIPSVASRRLVAGRPQTTSQSAGKKPSGPTPPSTNSSGFSRNYHPSHRRGKEKGGDTLLPSDGSAATGPSTTSPTASTARRRLRMSAAAAATTAGRNGVRHPRGVGGGRADEVTDDRDDVSIEKLVQA